MTVARTRNLRFWPGQSPRPALDGVSLRIDAGEVVVVEGPSGGGKSTLLRALSGLVPHFHGGRFAGRVTVMGNDTRTTGPAALSHLVGSVFQDPETQSVRSTVDRDIAFGLENLRVPADEIPRRTEEVLDLLGIVSLRDRPIGTLSGGERQRVALASVLAMRPRLLLMDEPTSQLDDDGVARLVATIEELAAGGVGVVVAEHHGDRLGSVADRTVRLRDGRIAGPDRDVDAGTPRTAEGGRCVLSVEDVDAGYGAAPVLTGCSLALRAGTVTALHGPNGSGKSTLARVICGLHRPARGRVVLDGRDVTDVPAEGRHPEIGTLLQDAGRWLLRESVADEIASASRRDSRGSSGLLDALDLAGLAARHPLDLSVGERERVALAAAVAADPRVIVLDEPSRGMDPLRRGMLADVVRARAADGAAVLMITHDAGFAECVADRHVVMTDGRVRDNARAVHP